MMNAKTHKKAAYEPPYAVSIRIRSEKSIMTTSGQIESLTWGDPYDNGNYDPFNF